MAKYHILTMDGGGVRGVLTARLLDRLQQARPGFLDRTQLFAGTSTGSILAVGLAKGLFPAAILQLYLDHARHIFADDFLHQVGDLWGLTGAKYQTKNRFEGIHPAIGDLTLGELLPKNVLVATFQLDSENPLSPSPIPPHSWKAKFFHNYPGGDSDANTTAIDVIMRSSAAPTYFPIYQGFIDGGVVANNPSICALAQAIHPTTGGQDIHDIILLSVGTGTKPQFITSRDGNWGLQQ